MSGAVSDPEPKQVTYADWFVEFDRYFVYALPAFGIVLFTWFWLRRTRFPISRRQPAWMLAICVSLLLLDEQNTVAVLYPTLYGCQVWVIFSNTIGNIILALFFARAWALYFRSRLHHQQMALAALLTRRNSKLQRQLGLMGVPGASLAGIAGASTTNNSGVTAAGSSFHTKSKAHPSTPVGPSDEILPGGVTGGAAAARLSATTITPRHGAKPSISLASDLRPAINEKVELAVVDENAKPAPVIESLDGGAATRVAIAGTGTAATGAGTGARLSASPRVSGGGMTIVTDEKWVEPVGRTTRRSMSTGIGALGGAAVGPLIAAEQWFIQHKYLVSNRFLMLVVALNWVVLSFGWIGEIAVTPDLQDPHLSFLDERCSDIYAILYQLVLAVAGFIVFGYKLYHYGVVDSLLFNFELRLNAVGFVLHLGAYILSLVLGNADSNLFVWHVSMTGFLVINGFIPIIHTYQYEKQSNAVREKFRLKRPHSSTNQNPSATGHSSERRATTVGGSNAPQRKATVTKGTSSPVLGGSPLLSPQSSGGSPNMHRSASTVSTATTAATSDLLLVLLQSPAGNASFRQFLDKEFSSENLLFWNAARDFRMRFTDVDLTTRDEDSRTQFVDDACNIFDDYVCTTAPLQVNISGANVNTLKRIFDPVKADPVATVAAVGGLAVTTPVPKTFKADQIRNGLTKDVFKAAETEIYGLMYTDSLSRYLQSSIFQDFERSYGSLQAMMAAAAPGLAAARQTKRDRLHSDAVLDPEAAAAVINIPSAESGLSAVVPVPTIAASTNKLVFAIDIASIRASSDAAATVAIGVSGEAISNRASTIIDTVQRHSNSTSGANSARSLLGTTSGTSSASTTPRLDLDPAPNSTVTTGRGAGVFGVRPPPIASPMAGGAAGAGDDSDTDSDEETRKKKRRTRHNRMDSTDPHALSLEAPGIGAHHRSGGEFVSVSVKAPTRDTSAANSTATTPVIAPRVVHAMTTPAAVTVVPVVPAVTAPSAPVPVAVSAPAAVEAPAPSSMPVLPPLPAGMPPLSAHVPRVSLLVAAAMSLPVLEPLSLPGVEAAAVGGATSAIPAQGTAIVAQQPTQIAAVPVPASTSAVTFLPIAGQPPLPPTPAPTTAP